MWIINVIILLLYHMCPLKFFLITNIPNMQNNINALVLFTNYFAISASDFWRNKMLLLYSSMMPLLLPFLLKVTYCFEARIPSHVRFYRLHVCIHNQCRSINKSIKIVLLYVILCSLLFHSTLLWFSISVPLPLPLLVFFNIFLSFWYKM